MAFLCVLLAACASRSGQAEFLAYKTSFDQFEQVSKGIIDRLAVAERDQTRQMREVEWRRTGARRFVVADASIFSQAVDPPLADHYRRGITVVASYNRVMLAYATGQGFASIENDLAALGAESLLLADTLAVGSDLTASLQPHLATLRTFARFALKQRSREVFRDEIVATAPQVRALLGTLRDGTVHVFERLSDGAGGEFAAGSAGDRAAFLKRQGDVRVLLSDWVVLMNLNIDSLSASELAVRSGSPAGAVAATTETMIELREAAQEARKHLASL